MAISRAQLEQQIQGLSNGGVPLGVPQDLQQEIDAAMAIDTNQIRSDVGMPSKEQEAIDALRQRLSSISRAPSGLEPPDFDKSFNKYQAQLRSVWAKTAPNIL